MNDPSRPVPTTHPPGFYFFFWGEFAERCSYYGMRAILPLYLTSVLAFEDQAASSIYSNFKAACYFLPLLGGFLADRYFGKYWTIIGFSVPYVLGQFLLGVPNQIALVIALLLLAGGSGVIKPNISTLMGLTYDQFRPGQERLRSSAFLWFYFAVNVGATLSMFLLPQIRDFFAPPGKHTPEELQRAYQIAFQFPAWLMLAALIVFAYGKRFYATETVGSAAPPVSPEQRAEQWKVLGSLFGIFALMAFFWYAYEQNDNLWVYFARDSMDRNINFGFFSKEFAPDGFQFINGLLVLTFVPIFDWFFQRFDPKGQVFRPVRKMLVGFMITAGSAAVMAQAAFLAGADGKVSGWWLILAYFVLTAGEVLVYGTGLELAFTAAPAHMKSFVTACFLMTNTLGNVLNSITVQWYDKLLTPAQYFLMTAIITLLASVAFYFVGRKFDRATPPA